MTRSQLIGAVGLLLAATLSWGGMFPVVKPALAVMDPYNLTLLRYGAAALIFLIILGIAEGPGMLLPEGRLPTLLGLGAVGFAGFNLLALTGLAHTRPEHGAVIMGMMPMITALLTWLFKGIRPQAFTLGAIAVSFAGVFLVITGGDPGRAFGDGGARWDLLFLAGAFCWVSYTLGAQRFPTWSPLRYTALTSTMGAVVIGAITFGMTRLGLLHTPSLQTIASLHWTLVYLIGPGALVAVLSWNTGIRLIGAVNGVLFINFVPITAFVIGALQGRSFSFAELAGTGLVIGALIANNLCLRRAERRNAQLRRMPSACEA